MEKMFTVDEVRDHYGVSRRTVYDWIRDKKLAAVKPSKALLVKQSALEAFEEKYRARA